MKYPLWKRLCVRVFGMVEIELRQPQGFKAPIMFYLAYCPAHGYYEDYLHGFAQYLMCPKCGRLNDLPEM